MGFIMLENAWQELTGRSSPPEANQTPDEGLPSALLGLVIPHGICTLFVLLRVIARVFLLRKWFIDDTLVLGSWLFASAVCVVYGIAAQTPDILHADEEALEASMGSDWGIHPYIMRTYLGLIFYQITLCLTKLSILSFYLRMFSSRPKELVLVWCTIVFVVLFGVPMLFMSIFQCHPSAGQFFGRPMACFGFSDLLISSASFHAATDVWLILLIVPCISGLDIPAKQKVVLSIVLNLGIFVIAAGVVRLMLALREDFRPDLVGVTTTLAFFVMTMLECDMALICASAPTLRPLLSKMFPWIMGDPRRRSMQPRVARNSFDLTSVVSYHGYPWTGSNTPMGRSRNASMGSNLNKLSKRMPHPPVPALNISHRTPTSLSLRSMMTGMGGTKSRQTMTGDGRPILNESPRSSLAMTAVGDEQGSRPTDHIQRPPRLNLEPWRQSQESLVFGANDPLSPASPTSSYSNRSYHSPRLHGGGSPRGYPGPNWGDRGLGSRGREEV